MDWSLSTSSSDSDSVDNKSLFGFVSEFSSLVGSSGVINSSDDWKLSIFPSSDSHKESHNIALLFTPKFLQIFVDTHFMVINIYINITININDKQN